MIRHTLDVISIGGATRDIFFKTSKGRLIPEPGTKRGQLLAFEYGTKIIPEEVYLTQGGGGHNSSSAFARLGLRTAAALSVGDDGSGRRIKRLLDERSVDTRFIRFDKHIATALSIVVTVERDHIAFLFRGANDHLMIEDIQSLSGAEWFYVTSLTGRGVELIPRLAGFIRTRGKKLALNPGSLQLQSGYRGLKDILEATEVLLVNFEEAGELAASLEPSVDLDDEEALLSVLERMGPRTVVITEGKDGSCYYSEGNILHEQAVPAPVHDTTGAGDAFGATFVAGLIMGFEVKRALKLAAINAASVVTRLGAVEGLLSLTELEGRIAGYGAA